MEALRKNESQLRFVPINPWWNITNNKGKWESKGEMGWRVVKIKELKKIDSWKEAKEESGNIGLVNCEDCRDRNHV
jgi:hypothetical protein